MTDTAADARSLPAWNRTRDSITFFSQWAIGATGAVGTQVTSDTAITLTRTGVGTYTLTYPKCFAMFIDFQLLAADATPTAASFILTAESPTAGTATIVAINGTAAAEIESGSTLKIQLTAYSRCAPGSD